MKSLILFVANHMGWWTANQITVQQYKKANFESLASECFWPLTSQDQLQDVFTLKEISSKAY